MKNQKISLLLFICLGFINVVYANPANLSCAKNQIIAYYNDLAPDSNYIKDINTIVKHAEHYMDLRIAENNHARNPAKLAIVFDIDDTSVSHYLEIKKDDFSNTNALIDGRYLSATAPAIAPIKRLYNEAVAKSISVFFISVRKPLVAGEALRPYTIQNLQNAGYAGWTELYLPTGDDLTLPSATYKTKIRKMLTEQGYDIILNLGDQDSDLVGGYADHTAKLPNYLYSTSPTPCDAGKVCH